MGARVFYDKIRMCDHIRDIGMETLIVVGMMPAYVCDPFLRDYNLVCHNLGGHNLKYFDSECSECIQITTTIGQTALFKRS